MKESLSIFFAIVGITISVLALFWILIDSYRFFALKRFRFFILRKSVLYIAGTLFAIHFIIEKSKILIDI